MNVGYVVSFEEFVGGPQTTMRFLPTNLLVLEPKVMEYITELCMEARELESQAEEMHVGGNGFSWSSVVKKVRKRVLKQVLVIYIVCEFRPPSP